MVQQTEKICTAKGAWCSKQEHYSTKRAEKQVRAGKESDAEIRCAVQGKKSSDSKQDVFLLGIRPVCLIPAASVAGNNRCADFFHGSALRAKQINTKPLAVSGCVGGTEAKQIAADSQVKPKSAGARQESDYARSPAACKPGARVFQTVRGRLPSVYSCSERGKCKDGNDKKASYRWF